MMNSWNSVITRILAGMIFLMTAGGMISGQEQAKENVNEIERMKAKYEVANSIADMTPTVCDAAGLRLPKTATANPISEVLEPMRKAFDGRPVQKVFLYCGDCLGDVLLQKYPVDFHDVLAISDAVIKSANVMKTVTPVCFATIFCGAGPESHGIHVYEKPVVKIETLFDVFLEAGKKIAIFSMPDNSVITIFRERNIDYIECKSDAEAAAAAIRALNDGNDYDLIVVHDCEYDTVMHQTGTESPESEAARRAVLKRWVETVTAVDEAWRDFDHLAVLISDHGSHNNQNGKGVHGEDVLSDAVVNHFYHWRAVVKK